MENTNQVPNGQKKGFSIEAKHIGCFVASVLGIAYLVLVFGAGDVQTVEKDPLAELSEKRAAKVIELSESKKEAVLWLEKYHSDKKELDAINKEEIQLINKDVNVKAPLPTITPTTPAEGLDTESPMPGKKE